MAKGFFTQTFCLLTESPTDLGDIKSALQTNGFEIAKEIVEQENTCFGGDSLLIPFLPEVNGYVAVDVVNEPWPDTMGDPQSDMMTFGAWSMGHYGPLTYPLGLQRAQQHSWSWEGGRTIAERHQGFIRLRLSYVSGSENDAPVLPEDYDPIEEMLFLSRMVCALQDVVKVICYFNPNGEVLRDLSNFSQVLAECNKADKIPLLLWTNVRFFNLNDTFCFMDTVGNEQLDIRDVETVFPKDSYNPADIDYYLRNVTHYLLDMDGEFHSGESIDGPGETNLSWVVEVLDEGVNDPPRQVIRLYPKANRDAVKKLFPDSAQVPVSKTELETNQKKSRWKFW